MNGELFNYTSKSAYFIWNSTKHENALDVWYCAEDIACFLETNNIFTNKVLRLYKNTYKEDLRYINFIRNLAYRIHIYTNNNDHIKNWFIAESLFEDTEWTDSILSLSKIYRKMIDEGDLITKIKSDLIKEYYFFHQNKKNIANQNEDD